ncbi:MAG TPA: MauE/DoxX family redox-associated membrane protein [Thermoanaerobaculia bacterium]|nr:MauE/DoxX family redox-associated membrane protein [Thermoanaerobaculia bacterium]
MTEPIGSSTSRGRSPSRWLGTLGGVFLGAVLLVAVWAKALDPAAFAEQIRIEGLDALLSAPTMALITLALEAGLGLALLLGVRRLWVLVPASLLVAFFVFLTGRAWWMSAHGWREAEACGCFGNLVQRTPAEAFWQDLLLLVPALLLAYLGREGTARFPAIRVAVVAVITAAVALFAWKAPDLPLDDLATRLRPGVSIEKLCAGGGEEAVCLDTVAPELKQGEHLVVLAKLDDPALEKAVDELNAYADRGGDLWLLSASPAEQHRAFFWRWGPAFEVVEAPEPLLRPLYRRLPRAFRVRDGRVIETWAGLPLTQLAAGEPAHELSQLESP